MPQITLAEFNRRVLCAVGIVAVALLLWHLRNVLAVLFGGVLIGTMLYVGSGPLARRADVGTGVAAVLVAVGIVLALVLAAAFIGDRVAAQVSELRAALPGAWQRFESWLHGVPGSAALQISLAEATQGLVEMSRVMRYATVGLGALANGILMAFLGVFLAAAPDRYVAASLSLAPPARRAALAEALYEAGQDLRYWLLGRLASMLVVGLLSGVGLWWLGVPLALSLGLLAGLLEFVPYLGPVAAALPAVMVAFAADPATALYVALLYLAIQQFEGYLLTPLVQRWAVQLLPAFTLAAVLVFGFLFGLLGVVIAVPLAVVLRVFVRRLYVERALEGLQPDHDPRQGASG